MPKITIVYKVGAVVSANINCHGLLTPSEIRLPIRCCENPNSAISRESVFNLQCIFRLLTVGLLIFEDIKFVDRQQFT